MTRLAYCPLPQDGESPFGLLFHVARGNAFGLNALWYKLGVVSPKAAVSEPAVVPVLSEMLDVPEEALRSHLYLRDPGPPEANGPLLVRVGQMAVLRDRLRYRERRVCPRCIGGGAFQKRAWDLKYTNRCSMHAVMLAKNCHCGRLLSWSVENRCLCGLDYKDIPVEEAKFTLAHEEIDARICGTTVLKSEFTSLSLQQLLSLFKAVGLSYRERRHRMPEAVGTEYSMVDDIDVGAQLIGTEAKLGLLLDWLRRHRKGGGDYGMFGRLGRLLHDDLSAWGGASAWVGRYLAVHPEVDFALRRGQHSRLSSPKFISLWNAIRLLGVGYSNGRRLLVKEGLITADQGGLGNRVAVRLSAIKRLEKTLTDSVTLPTAARILGVRPACCRDLVDAGFIEPL